MKYLVVLIGIVSQFIFVIGCYNGVVSGPLLSYRVPAGVATAIDFVEISERSLIMHNIVIDDVIAFGNSIELRSEWKYLQPSYDEYLNGMVEKRYNVNVRAKGKSGSLDIYRIRISGDAFGKYLGEPNWVRIPVNTEMKNEIDLLAIDLKDKFENRIRIKS